LGGVKLVAELDGLVRPAAAVGEADQALPHLAVLVVGPWAQVDLDRPVPQPGLAVEGIDLDLVKLVDLATPDGVVRLANQPLHAGANLHQQRLRVQVRRAPK
jgi:hypothetical protein